MPALVVLERLPAPALAVDRGGTILFANGAFRDMLGYATDELQSMKWADIFSSPATNGRAPAGSRTSQLVELAHKHGHSVWASMSQSAMLRSDDTVELTTFVDRTEQLWIDGLIG